MQGVYSVIEVLSSPLGSPPAAVLVYFSAINFSQLRHLGHRTIPELMQTRIGSARSYTVKHRCKPGEGWSFRKPLAWWILFLHQSEEFIDKFILDTLFGLKFSHLCHWSLCLALSDLTFEFHNVNMERNSCKGGGWLHLGGYNAPGSLHGKLQHCLSGREILPPCQKSLESRLGQNKLQFSIVAPSSALVAYGADVCVP